MKTLRRYVGRRYHGWVSQDLACPDSLLERPEVVENLPRAEHLLDCVGRQIYRVPLVVGGRLQSCFTYLFTNKSVSRAIGRTSAFRVLRNSELLSKRGFRTIEVLCALKKRREPMNWTSFVIAREIDEVFEVPSRGNHVFRIHPVLDWSAAWSEGLGRELARFHNAGFIHGDLKSRHILAQPTQAGGTFVFHFVDLEKCRFVPQLPEFARAILVARDLIQLFASTPDPPTGFPPCKRHLLDAYLGESRYGPRFARLVNRTVGIYGSEGGFQQGKTVVQNLWSMAKRDKRV